MLENLLVPYVKTSTGFRALIQTLAESINFLWVAFCENVPVSLTVLYISGMKAIIRLKKTIKILKKHRLSYPSFLLFSLNCLKCKLLPKDSLN
jgi:hypothetical protein